LGILQGVTESPWPAGAIEGQSPRHTGGDGRKGRAVPFAWQRTSIHHAAAWRLILTVPSGLAEFERVLI
jgi:hypothetical protein